jgi:uncharacterized protein YfiM (DUF2279 family)
MKKLILCSIFSIFIGSKINAQIPSDKVMHFYSGLFISTTTYTYLLLKKVPRNKSILMGIAAGTLAGAVKEIWDKSSEKGTCDPKDFLWTSLGASLISVHLTFHIP